MIDLEYKSEEISQERKQKKMKKIWKRRYEPIQDSQHMKNIIETPGKEKEHVEKEIIKEIKWFLRTKIHEFPDWE